MRLIAHNVFLKSNSIRDIAALKAFLKHSLQTEKVELVSLVLDTGTVDINIDPNDLLNVFFGISTYDNWQLHHTHHLVNLIPRMDLSNTTFLLITMTARAVAIIGLLAIKFNIRILWILLKRVIKYMEL